MTDPQVGRVPWTDDTTDRLSLDNDKDKVGIRNQIPQAEIRLSCGNHHV